MNWPRVYAVLKAVASLSGIVAFVSFAYTYSKDVAIRKSADDRAWQSVAIYSELTKAGQNGISLENLIKAVQGELINGQAFKDVDPGVATEKQVLSGLIELGSRNSVILGTDNLYRVPQTFASDFSHEAIGRRISEYQDFIVSLVVDNPNKFSQNDLRKKLLDRGASKIDILRALSGLMGGPGGPPVLVPGNVPENDGKAFDDVLLEIVGS